MIFLLLFTTVPHEYPFLEVVKREIAFIPKPELEDSSSYLRTLDISYAKDSLHFYVDGKIVERWQGGFKDSSNFYDDGQPLGEFSSIADTTIFTSPVSFTLRFDAPYAWVVSMDVPLALRGHESARSEFKVCSIIERFGVRCGLFTTKVRRLDTDILEVKVLKSNASLLVNSKTGAVVKCAICGR